VGRKVGSMVGSMVGRMGRVFHRKYLYPTV
jgi:hypothetical protein